MRDVDKPETVISRSKCNQNDKIKIQRREKGKKKNSQKSIFETRNDTAKGNGKHVRAPTNGGKTTRIFLSLVSE
jgi:hypothetical protein